MSLQEQIKTDLMAAMKAKDEEKKSILRVILGEFNRQTQKEISNIDVIKILKKLVKSEKETLSQSHGNATNRFIQVTESYLPRGATNDEIRSWITENIDFTKYKNKMQAMKDIMAHYGASADGNQVKKILQDIDN
jgi:uncharacterized protein YqeY